MSARVMAGIVTYNPNIRRLQQNIASIKLQVNSVIIIDNASDNQNEIIKLCEEFGIAYEININNEGIARALNYVFSLARDKFDWVITLDQDSICPFDYIKKARRYFKRMDVGIITTLYRDANINKVLGKGTKGKKYELVKRAITSAAIVRVAAYDKTTGYDNNFFIDYVDFDFSVKIRSAGYLILRMNDTILNHELGASEIKKIAWFHVRYTIHNAMREYYIAKNIIVFIRKYYKKECIIRDALSLCKHFVFVILFDSSRSEKLKALCDGVKSGLVFQNRDNMKADYVENR